MKIKDVKKYKVVAEQALPRTLQFRDADDMVKSLMRDLRTVIQKIEKNRARMPAGIIVDELQNLYHNYNEAEVLVKPRYDRDWIPGR